MPPSPEQALPAADHATEAPTVVRLDTGWTAASTPPGAAASAADLDAEAWLEARVPGTAAAVLEGAGLPLDGDLDAEDWWFRVSFKASPAGDGEEVLLHLDGVATVAEVLLNGESILTSESMFAEHAVDVSGRLAGENELVISCRALEPLLAERRKPRARWRTRLVKSGNLRFFRTMLLGRAPGFAPGPAPVGPWRPVWLERRQGVAIGPASLKARLDGDTGVLHVSATVRSLDGAPIESVAVELTGPSGTHAAGLELDGERASGELRVPEVAPWWPHTHGEPALHDVAIRATRASDAFSVDAGRVGFRTLQAGPDAEHDVLEDGLDLHVNGIRVFARGAVWTPLDFVEPGSLPREPSNCAGTGVRRGHEHAAGPGNRRVREPGLP